ncbi:ArsR/SmtB family transcription factor [Flexivirga alba]|uniref:ArsR/SmtB family transcription factor n=1 Tax=Flexivirga alba TaxID=702742 RepID=A0ABW2AN05_9MICO
MSRSQDRSEPRRIVDPRELKALSHPLRMRLFGELTARGPSRAVDLANAVAEPANSVSFHLRQLARYGLVEDDPEHGTDGRERWWRATTDEGLIVDFHDLEAMPGGPAAVGAFKQVTESTAHALTALSFRHLDESTEGPKTWFNNFVLHLSRSELDAFLDDQWEVTSRWMQRSREVSNSADGETRHTYFGVSNGAPLGQVLETEEAADRTGDERSGKSQ